MIKFKPCPMCGKTKRLQITPEGQYANIFGSTGSAAIRVECMDCNIELWEHTYKEPEYIKRMEMLADKWNAMPRRGDAITKDERREMAISTIRDALDALERAQAVGGDAR